MKRRVLFILLAVAVSSAAVAIAARGVVSDTTGVTVMVTAPVVKGDIAETVILSGVVRETEPIEVTSLMSGTVASLAMRPGDKILKGQRVAELLNGVPGTRSSDVISLIEGEVVRVLASNGREVSGSDGLVAVRQTGMRTIEVQLSASQAAGIVSGQRAYVLSTAEPSVRYEATVRTVASAFAGSGDAYYRGWIDVPDPAHQLDLSATVQVCIVGSQVWGALTIPRGALGERAVDGSYTVHVASVDGGQAIRRVTTGLMNEVLVQVYEGLSVHEQVVVTPRPATANVNRATYPSAVLSKMLL